MRPQLKARRAEMLRLVGRFPVASVIKTLAEKYQVKEQSIRNDWGRRKTWLTKLVNLDDPTLLHKIIGDLETLISTAWLEYNRGDNSAARVGALRTIAQLHMQRLKVLQFAGIIKAPPIEVKTLDEIPEVVWEQLSEEEKDVITQSARIFIKARSKEQPESFH